MVGAVIGVDLVDSTEDSMGAVGFMEVVASTGEGDIGREC